MNIEWKDIKVDRTVLSVGSLTERFSDRKLWLQKSPAERMAALEVLRQVIYGYDPTDARLQRVFTIARRGED